MLIGVPKEIKTHEYRVGLVPGSVRELLHHGHQVVVEKGAGAGIGFGIISFGLAWIALRARRAKRLIGPQAMVGHTAIAMTPIMPVGQDVVGQVEVRGEIWRAMLVPGEAPVAKGAQVTVRGVHDLTLTVSAKG